MNRHYLALDGLRGLALIAIVATHTVIIERGPLPLRLVGLFAQGSWCSITLFFALSGFLISGILLDARGRHGYFGNFYARRSLRIFPLYYVFLFFAIVVLPRLAPTVYGGILPTWRDTYPYWLYLDNMSRYFPARLDLPPFHVLWSLAVEEQVYLVWPFLIALCPTRLLPRVLCGMAVGALVWRVAMIRLTGDIHFAYSWTPACLDAFALGTLAALWVRRDDPSRSLRGQARVALACSACFIAGLTLGQRHFSFWLNPPVVLTLGLTAVSVASASLIALVVLDGPGGPLAGPLSSPTLRSFGRYSYAMYLVHAMVIFLALDPLHRFLARWIAPGKPWLPLVDFAVVLTCSYAIGFLSWHLFEKHVLRLKAIFPMPVGKATPLEPVSRAPAAARVAGASEVH